ncbi:hypothetical protein B0H13DRAFT_2337130 [Mycena leptocephala]|nr:hypothetical protein B0H13DRAFT_2337130 [Mycena leptocephala]
MADLYATCAPRRSPPSRQPLGPIYPSPCLPRPPLASEWLDNFLTTSFPIHLAAILFLHRSLSDHLRSHPVLQTLPPAHGPPSCVFTSESGYANYRAPFFRVARRCALKQRIHDWVFATRFDELVTKDRKDQDPLATEDHRVPARRAIDLSDVPPVLENPVGDIVWLLVAVVVWP